jgi:hypothetical protein
VGTLPRQPWHLGELRGVIFAAKRAAFLNASSGSFFADH